MRDETIQKAFVIAGAVLCGAVAIWDFQLESVDRLVRSLVITVPVGLLLGAGVSSYYDYTGDSRKHLPRCAFWGGVFGLTSMPGLLGGVGAGIGGLAGAALSYPVIKLRHLYKELKQG